MRRNAVETVIWEGETINQMRIPETAPAIGATYYTIKQNEPLDLVAWKFYKDESLWYLIADVNEIDNPLEPIEQGIRIIIPPR